jgi:hypothetical protein
MDKIPKPNTTAVRASRGALRTRLLPVLLFAFAFSALSLGLNARRLIGDSPHKVPKDADQILNKCRQQALPAGPPEDFHQRAVSDRFEPGTPPTLITNATIWTGRVSGYEVLKGSILIDKGIIQAIGDIESAYLNGYSELVTVDAGGAWVTPGSVGKFVCLFLVLKYHDAGS